VRYENTSASGDDISGLDDQREYHVIWFTDKKVQLGEQIDSSLSSVVLDQDRLNFGRSAAFAGPFDLSAWNPLGVDNNGTDKWDIVTYKMVGDEAIGGLTDENQYWVNRVDDDEVMLFDYTLNDVPVAPLGIDGTQVVGSNQLELTGHGFQQGQAVTYRSQDPVSFSSGVVNVDVADADPPVDDDSQAVDLTAEDSTSLSHTVYLGNNLGRFEDGDIVEYWADAADLQWYWTEGPDNRSTDEDDSQSSADLHNLTGTQFWGGGPDGSAVSDSYTNWAGTEPNNSGGTEHFAEIRPDGEWNDRDGDTGLSAYVIEYPQFILHDTTLNWADAWSFAAAKDGWLPSISSDDELQLAITAAAGNTVWLGGSDDADEDTWIWDTGGADPNHSNPFWQGGKNGYSTGTLEVPWNGGEPNDGGGATAVRNKETVLEMYGSGAWNDTNDGHKNKNRVLVEMPRYEVITSGSSMTFSDARDNARAKGGWIATIGSAEDNQTIAQMLVDHGASSAWIGASDSQIIRGLENHGRYQLKIASDTTNHRNSIQLYSLTTPQTPIAIDATGLPSSVNHYLLPVDELPLVGLNSGQTYYVSNISGSQFSLAETAEKATAEDVISDLSGLDPENSGTNIGFGSFIGTMGIDLTSTGTGAHNLLFDITEHSTGTQSLPYVKLGPRTKPDGTGTAASHVHSVGGSLVAQSVRPQSTSTTNPEVSINLDAGSLLHAAEDIDMTALSAGNAKSKAEGYGGALLASGAGSTVAANLDHSARINVFGTLTANGSLTMESKISDEVDAHADTKSYGAVDANALANTTITESFESWITIDHGAHLLAGEEIEINAYTDIVDRMTATTHSGALFGSSKANQAEGSGIHIAAQGENQNRTGIEINDADLLARDTVYLRAKVLGIDTSPIHAGDEIVQAFGGGMANANQAKAEVSVTDTACVELNDGARITSRDVEIWALHEDVDLYTKAHTRRGRAESRADATVTYTGTSVVTSSAGATIHADTLDVYSQQNITQDDFISDATTDRGSSHEYPTTTLTANRKIDWNATVLGRGKAILEVDNHGVVTTADGVVLNGGTVQEGDQYTDGQTIIVDALTYEFTHQSSAFHVDTLSNISGTAEVTGNALFYAQVHADLKNHSTHSLELPAVDLADFILDDSSHDITVNAPTDDLTIREHPDSDDSIGGRFTVANLSSESSVSVIDTFDASSLAYASRGPEFSIGSVLEVSTDHTINKMEVYNRLQADGSLKFLIFESESNQRVYTSESISFKADTSNQPNWKTINGLDFTLQAGRTYYVGAISDVAAEWYYDTTANSQNGVLSPTSNANFSNFEDPRLGGPGLVNGIVRLWEASDAVPVRPLLTLNGNIHNPNGLVELKNLWGDIDTAGVSPVSTSVIDTFDSSGLVYTTRVPEYSVGSVLEVSTDHAISGMDVYNRMHSDGLLKFLVFESSSNQLVYSSEPIAVSTDTLGQPTWKTIDGLNFTLQAGQTYYVGAISDAAADWYYDTTANSQNGISSPRTNANFRDFDSPYYSGPGGVNGIVRMWAASGSSGRTVIDAHELLIHAPLGSIANPSQNNGPLARLHQRGRLTPSLIAIAGEQLLLDVQAQPDDAGRVRGIDRLEGSVVDVGLMAWGDSILVDNPAGYWKLDDTSGTTAVETLGTGMRGVYSSGVSLNQPGAIASDPDNKAVRFPGGTSTSSVTIQDDPRLYGGKTQTVSGWLKIDSFDKDWQNVYFKGNPGDGATDYSNNGDNRENVVWVNSAGYLHFNISLDDGAGQRYLNSPSGAIQANRWHHFATTVDTAAGTMAIFIDGNRVVSGSIPNTRSLHDTAGDWLLGNSPSGQSSLHGRLDEFAVFSKVLSADQIANQYQAGSASDRFEVDSHYVINGFFGGTHSTARHREIRSHGDLTVRGLAVDGAPAGSGA
ncbi:MAG: LamG-like jellyroll fold domain-containing protein, partial [Planctomycetaceae bacterium]